MENREVFTIRSVKKGAILCLKLTIIFGILFGVLFGEGTLDGIIWSFIISGMYCFGIGFGNGLINNYLSSKWNWITQTNLRVWAGIIAIGVWPLYKRWYKFLGQRAVLASLSFTILIAIIIM